MSLRPAFDRESSRFAFLMPFVTARLSLAASGEQHAESFLSLPLWIWQVVNLALFLGLLLYFVARPMAATFRKRQLEVEERLKEAERRRVEAARFEAEIHERLSRLDRELDQIRSRGMAEGEAERTSLFERAAREAERVRREAEEEIGRRLASAKEELKKTAADLTAAAANEMVAAQMTEEDRRRLLQESIARLGEGR